MQACYRGLKSTTLPRCCVTACKATSHEMEACSLSIVMHELQLHGAWAHLLCRTYSFPAVLLTYNRRGRSKGFYSDKSL